MSTVIGMGRPLPVASSNRVADSAADDLVSGLADLAATTMDSRIGRSERMSRAGFAAQHVRDVRAIVGALDPYRDGKHSRIADHLAIVGHRQWQRVVGDLDEARERVSQARQHELVAAQTRAWADLSGLTDQPTTVAAPATDFPAAAVWLNTRVAVTQEPLGPAQMVPGAWADLPAATVNPSESNPITGGPAVLDGVSLPWTAIGWGVNESQQVIDWSVDGGRELERVIRVVVDTGLEKSLIGAITAGAPTAATLEAAEAAAGAAWPAGADLVLANAEDLPAVRRLYGVAGLWPAPLAILPTGALTAGTAAVVASSAVHAEASMFDWTAAVSPKELGREIVGYRYGRARLRKAGAVQLVTL